MDEERCQSFYAPKKLFSKRIRESSESDDFSRFLNNDYFPYSPSVSGNLDNSSVLNGFTDNHSSTTQFINNTSTNYYSRIPDLSFNGRDQFNDDYYVNSYEQEDKNRFYKPFIKTEPVDFSFYNTQCSYPCSEDKFYNNLYVPNINHNRLSSSDDEAVDLSVKQTPEEKIKNCHQIQEHIFNKGSPFLEKFRLQKLQKFKIDEQKTESKQPFHVSYVKEEKQTGKNFKTFLYEIMGEPAVNNSNISLTQLSPVEMKSFQNHVSSTNMTNFDRSSNHRLTSTQAVNDNDFNDLMENEMIKAPFLSESVNNNAVSSTDSKLTLDNSNGSSHKKQGKKWMKGDMVCQVCGDKAAGFYCGAFACEACKKFFMRSCRNEKTKYVCLRDKKCQITAESRVQCQYCRLQKCLTLNMYSPGSDVKKENVGDIPCRVCGAPSSGFHFGALTCEGCKGFFRRMAKERELGKYRCSKNSDCEINTSTRNLCKSCRYQKCVDAGMSIEGSRIGRQPNAVKYAISLEVKNQSGTNTELEDNSVKFTLEDLNNSVIKPEIERSPDTKRPHVNSIESEKEASPQKIPRQTGSFNLKKPTLDYDETISWIVECDKDLKVVQMPKKTDEKNVMLLSDVGEIWEEIVKPFYYHSSVIIKFAKKCQPFRKLALEDQVRMLQQALYPIVVLNHSRYYVLETKQYSYFGWSVIEREHIWKYFPFYRILGEHFENTGDNVKLLQLNDDEFTILSILILLNPDVPGLSDKEKVRQLQADILDFLEYYLNINYPEQPSRYGLILVRLSELNFYAFQHLEGIREMLRVYPFLSMPQLYREMFINI